MRRIAAGALCLAVVLLGGAPAARAADTERATVTWDQATDLDLHVYDGEGGHAYYATPEGIPDATMSADIISEGGPEIFTDHRDPSSRRFGFRVCWYAGEIDVGTVNASLSWRDENGGVHEENFALATPGECHDAGAVDLIGVEDTTAPTVTLDAPADGATTADSTPTLSGRAGTAPRDNPDVGVTVYTASGEPIQGLAAQVVDGGWSVEARPLADGEYTVQAEQSDSAGNLGQSAPHTFTVRTASSTPTATPTPTPAPQQQVAGTEDTGPEPVLGETVVAGAVSGSVRIKGRDGKFHVLGANEAIPLGSTVDATKGKVKITAASGPGGAKQSGLFYQGAFVVTQTGGSKPITQLALSGALRCGKGKGPKASQSARRKVRRLWGDGKGRFRTKGRYGAATVRGTKWVTEDRCGGTLVRVTRGKVAVRDFAKRKTVIVKQGKSYFARAKGSKTKSKP